MKKTRKLSFIMAFLFVFCLSVSPKNNGVNLKANAITGNYVLNPTEYSIANYYSYRLNQALTVNPDTFEAWINVPANSPGGVIMSNYISGEAIMSNHHHIDYSVDVSGRVRVDWHNTNIITFANGFVADGRWHHIAVIRDTSAKTFTLYVDGKLNTIASAFNSPNAISDRAFSIGVDLIMESTQKRPLKNGRIKQITLYNGAISAERVLQDMNNAAISTNDTNATLITNVYLGEPWTQRIVTDTSGNGINANLSSYEKLVKMVDPGPYDYSILVIPDVQTTVHWKSKMTTMGTHPFEGVNPPATYDNNDNTVMAQWIRWLKTTPTRYNTKFAIQTGDLSDYGQYEEYYKWTAYYMNQLNGVLPWSFVQGNHDYDLNLNNKDMRYSTYFNTHFPYSVHSQLPGFGGAMEEGSMSNTYYRYTIGNVKYLVINLEMGPRRSTIRWAGRLCEQFADHRVIVNTHAYIEADASFLEDNDRFSASTYAWTAVTEANSGRFLFDELICKYPNIFLAVCGHITAEDLVYRIDTGVHGNKIMSVLVDFQTAEYRNSGAGTEATCMMFFNEQQKTINFAYYSAYYDAVYNVQNQFRISFADPNNPTIGA